MHGHGGILLELLKAHAFSWDLKPGGRLLWYSTTSWMMWNALVAALLVRSSIVMLDGDPAWPDAGWQWRVAEETKPSFMGASPAFLMGCRKAGLRPGRDCDLSSIRVFGTAGSPLPAEGYRYVYEELGPDVLLINGSGGTDVCSGIVGGSPLLPVYEGEISGRLLGVATDAFDPEGKPLVGELGELVITRPMPSMPVELWGDADGTLYRSSYFELVSRHLAPGRLDQVLGARKLRRHRPLRRDAQPRRRAPRDRRVLRRRRGAAGDRRQPRRAPRGRRGRPGRARPLRRARRRRRCSTTTCESRIAAGLRSQLSPRHVPDMIRAVPAIPRTLTGKKLEAPVKRILRGETVDAVASRDSLVDPAALDTFAAIAIGDPRG